MDMRDDLSTTHASMFERLMDVHDEVRQQAWKEFVDKYGKLVWGYAHQLVSRWNRSEQDGDDLAQTVLQILMDQAVNNFRYDPNQHFRGWLRGVVRNTWLTAVRERVPVPLVQLSELEVSADGFVAHLEPEIDRQLQFDAEERLRSKISLDAWRVYILRVYGRLSLAEVGLITGMKQKAVSMAASRVRDQVNKEMHRR
jgi:RNA polymerase sigma factor (sigma-70 family)